MGAPYQRVERSHGDSWPRPSLATDTTPGLFHKLTQGPPEAVTQGELLFAGSIIRAYEYLICELTPEAAAEVNHQMTQALREGTLASESHRSPTPVIDRPGAGPAGTPAKEGTGEHLRNEEQSSYVRT